MFCYIYKDMDKYTQCDDLTTISKVSDKEQFRCFEWKHKPTSTRMVHFNSTEVTFSAWSV